MRYIAIATFLLTTLVGCQSDYKIIGITESNDVTLYPEIEVDPLSHNFGALSSGSETMDIPITITNVGDGVLDLDSIYLHGNSSKF